MENFTLINKVIVVSAKRNSGKSILCRYLVKTYKDSFEEIFVISMTEGVNSFYKTFINEKNIFCDFSPEWLEKFYDKIEAGVKEGQNKNVLLILDDCGSEKEFYKNPIIKRICTRGRHIFLGIIILSQYLYQTPPVVRSNCDYLIAGQMNRSSQDILADEFLMGNIDKKEFIRLYMKASSNHGFFVINNSSVKDINDIDLLYGRIQTPKEYL